MEFPGILVIVLAWLVLRRVGWMCAGRALRHQRSRSPHWQMHTLSGSVMIGGGTATLPRPRIDACRPAARRNAPATIAKLSAKEQCELEIKALATRWVNDEITVEEYEREVDRLLGTRGDSA